MFYIGVLIDIEGEEAEKALSSLSFLKIYGKKENQLLGVIELKDLQEWKAVEEALTEIKGFLGLSILSSFQDNSDTS
ncbi:MAG: hypothetical protein ABWJ99_02055 [Caldimicrobium sp.]